MSAGSSAPADEVVTALAQMAVIAVALAAVVLATRAMQVSFDKKQMTRARTEAAECCRQRIKTLSDRKLLYTSSPLPAPAAYRPDDAVTWVGSRGSSFEGDRRDSAHCSHNSGNNCPTPPANAAVGGAAALLSAASSLLQRRQQQQQLLAAASPPATGTSAASDRLDRRHSVGMQPGAAASPAGSSSLQHKHSDGLLETSRVLASVPPDTVTSTRQVLAAFNYDYSALHRRENSYVSGTSSWHVRTGS